MHGGQTAVAKQQKPKPVEISHMRLDSEISKVSETRRKQMAARLESESCLQISLAEAYDATAGLQDTTQARRIKEINAFLGSAEYALTAKRLTNSPITFLIEKASAKAEEFMAAQEIETAFMAISGALMFKPLSLERVSPSRRQDWSAKTTDAVERYKAWADHWSNRRKSHIDHTLECVIAAVIDQRPIRSIGADLGFHHSRIERAVLGGLRDYAARAGWVDGKIARGWMDAAEMVFSRRVA